jgi:hypothetical protein
MPKDTADIVGKSGSNFVATINSGSIAKAQLEVVNQPILKLAVGADERSITVTNLPDGDSIIWLALNWAPGEPNATVGVGVVNDGAAQSAAAPGILYDNDPTGEIELFGEIEQAVVTP